MTEPSVQRNESYHDKNVDFALKELKSSESGLIPDERQNRLKSHGYNRLPESHKRSALIRFLLQFHNVLIYVLLVSAAITLMLGHLTDALVILAVVVINALIGFIQEGKAEKAMDAIRQMLAPMASVMHNGERRAITADELVPGDIVFLEAGDKVPADLRLMEARGLMIQESILTGESVPVEKNTKDVAADAPIGDRACLAFSGTLVTGGQGKGIVVFTGAGTQIGHISGMLSDVEELTTPLVKQMSSFSRWLTVVILLVAALLLVFGHFVQNHDLNELFMAVVGLSVAAIPEGLPAMLTITLAIGVQAMAKRNAIVRRLPAIETLGSVSVICTDKTGTLTCNEMIVAAIATATGTYRVTGDGYEPDGAILCGDKAITPSDNPVFIEIARVAAICNDANLHEHEAVWSVNGDPMEGALLAMAYKAGLSEEEKQIWTRTDSIPFDAKHRLMATLNHSHEGSAYIFVKGAPEAVIEICKNQRKNNDQPEPIDSDYWRSKAEEIASCGQRVLALAAMPVDRSHTALYFEDLEKELILLGLVGLMDPPRAESVKAVAECRSAGIHVKMITGDHAKTAAAIGHMVGLENCKNVLTGADLDKMDDKTLAEAIKRTDIFARTSPENKLRLVTLLQAQNEVVAMTGDGVNDAPALKRADIGIAMGKKGSEASKEAAEIVLADDNFASIVSAVREGRTVYNNLVKIISWALPTGAGEASTLIVALLFGLTLPVTPVQILWVNLITAVALGIPLAFEPTEDSTMQRPPRPRETPLLTASLIWHIIFVSALFLCGVFGLFSYAIANGASIELARTIAVNTLVVMEAFHLLFIRNIHRTSLSWQAVKGTKILWAMVAVTAIAQAAITYLPPLQKIFHTESVPLHYMLLILGTGIALFVIVETEKRIRTRLGLLK